MYIYTGIYVYIWIGKHFVFTLRFNDNRNICCRMHSIAYVRTAIVRQFYGSVQALKMLNN